MVELLLVRGDVAAAEEVLRQTSPEEIFIRRQRRFLRGRLEAHAGQPDSAINALSALLRRREGVSHSLAVATLILLADTYVSKDSPEEAATVLEGYIDEHPADPSLDLLFAKLEEVYLRTRRPWRNELGRWARDGGEPRRAFAQWYLARAHLRSGRTAEASESFVQAINSSTGARSLAPAYVEYAQLLTARDETRPALAVLAAARQLKPSEQVLSRVDWLEAATQMRAGQTEEAAKRFESIANGQSTHAEDAFYNAALGWLEMGESRKFAALYERVSNNGGTDATADLLLEKGLADARKAEAGAVGSLRDFVQKFPNHPRISEALVTLADLSFSREAPDEAARYLEQARQKNPTPIARERADYLRVFLLQTREGEMIKAGQEFLQRHSTSPLAPEVQMKIGEVFFRAQDFTNAQTQFEQLARRHPHDPLAEKALFFAAQAARSTMAPNALDRAIELFDEVARRNGELKWAARNEQAAVERRLGQLDQASLIYEDVLANSTRAADRREALVGSADILSERGAGEATHYEQAVERYDRVLRETPPGSHWNNQALFKKAAVLQKLGNKAAALSTLYEVLEQDPAAERREFFWFYKAGFDAAELLEEQGKWESAVTVYESLASAGGPRSAEASSRLNRLRLERFLWE